LKNKHKFKYSGYVQVTSKPEQASSLHHVDGNPELQPDVGRPFCNLEADQGLHQGLHVHLEGYSGTLAKEQVPLEK